jgi:beta-lactamase class C
MRLPNAAALLVIASAPFAPAAAAASDTVARAAAAAFDGVIAEYGIPGLVVGVTHDGAHGFYTAGLASREDGRPVTPDTLFELGSISKLFNVTLAALAERRGALALDDAVAVHLDELEGSAAGEMTLMDLATHHSGGLPLQVPDEVASTDELIDWLETWQPAQPGARSYSNISIGLLGHITAQAMGMTYAEAFETVLLPEIGLEDTWIAVPADREDAYAYGYDRKTDAPIRVNPGVLDDEAYGVKSSARDMVTFMDRVLGHGDPSPDLAAALARTEEGRFRGERFTQAMVWERYPWPADLDTMVAGSGSAFVLYPQPVEAIEPPLPPQPAMILAKTGSTGGFGGYIAVLPGEDLGIVVLANRNYPNEARVRATGRLIEALLAE